MLIIKLTKTIEKLIILRTPVCLVIVSEVITKIWTTKQGNPVNMIVLNILSKDKDS